MRLLALIGLGAAASLACSQPSRGPDATEGGSVPTPGPVIEILDGGAYRAVLPPAMRQLLNDSSPGFEPWPISHYTSDVRGWYVVTHRSAPSSVVGDFNGDGVQDLVTEGHDRQRALRLCLLSTGRGFRFMVLQSTSYDTTQRDAGTAINYIVFQQPGRIGTNYTDSTIVVRTDGFAVVYFEKASMLYYWDGAKFVEFQTSD